MVENDNDDEVTFCSDDVHRFADEPHPGKPFGSCDKRVARWTLLRLSMISTFFMVFGIATIVLVATNRGSERRGTRPTASTASPASSPHVSPSATNATNKSSRPDEELIAFIQDRIQSLFNETESPQTQALVWSLQDDLFKADKEKWLVRFALVTIWFALGAPFSVYDLHDECSGWWTHVSCDSSGAVVELNLTKTQVDGTIPREIGLLTDLVSFVISNGGGLKGTIPEEVSRLTNLQSMSLDSNIELTGQVPNLSGMSDLRALLLYGTAISGTLPLSLCSSVEPQIDCEGKLSCYCCVQGSNNDLPTSGILGQQLCDAP